MVYADSKRAAYSAPHRPENLSFSVIGLIVAQAETGLGGRTGKSFGLQKSDFEFFWPTARCLVFADHNAADPAAL